MLRNKAAAPAQLAQNMFDSRIWSPGNQMKKADTARSAEAPTSDAMIEVNLHRFSAVQQLVLAEKHHLGLKLLQS